MKDEILIFDPKIEELAKKLAKIFSMDQEEALGIVYIEWDLVENLFHTYGKVEAVYQHLIHELNHTYGIV